MSDMHSWREWEIEDWNAKLLAHFFSKSGAGFGLPVVNLLVTADELARVAGAPSSDAQRARDSFVDAMLRGIPQGKEILENATDLPFSPTTASVPPPFVAHLIFTCVAAAESSDQLANESSYRERLNELAKGRCSGRFLHFLVGLWHGLRAWLALPANSKTFRELVLPSDLGYHTLIGYSELLAFPDRTDQRELSLVLHAAGMCGAVPPPGQAISAVAKKLKNFRTNFVKAFDEFRSAYFNSRAEGSDASLVNHRFWSAVIEASLRGREEDMAPETETSVNLIAYFEGEELELYLLTRDETARLPADAEFYALEEHVGDLKFAIVEKGSGSSKRFVEGLLAGHTQFSPISNVVRQGFVPLVRVASGQLAVAAPGIALANAHYALVRDELVAETRAKFAASEATCARPVQGWTFMEGLQIRPFDPGTEELGLSAVWILQRQLTPRKIFLSGGIRSDEGWLGFGEALPTISADGATSMGGAYQGRSFELTSTGENRWRLPMADYDGDVLVTAFREASPFAQATLRFLPSPASEEYKAPKDLHSFYTEGRSGVVPLTKGAHFSATDGQDDLGVKTGRVLFLGPNQGEFVADESAAAWKVIRGGRTNLIALPESRLAGEIPIAKADMPGLRRKWREFVSKSTPIAMLPELTGRLRVVRGMLVSSVELPPSNFNAELLPNVYSRRGAETSVDVVPLIRALAGRASSRRGIPYSEWKSLVCAFTALSERGRVYEKCSIDALTRCWQEGGFIDVLSAANWRSRSVFPIRPAFVIHKCGPVFVAALAGLCLDATVGRVKEAARRVGVDFDEKRSLCRMVPAMPILVSADLQAIQLCASTVGLPIRWALVGEALPNHDSVEKDLPPPTNYDREFRLRVWSLTGKETQLPIIFSSRDDRPAYWSVTQGMTSSWSYEKNTVRRQACKVVGIHPFKAHGDHEIIVEHAYLPLPLARYAALVGPVLPGPDNLAEGGEGHIYAFGTRTFRNEILSASNS